MQVGESLVAHIFPEWTMGNIHEIEMHVQGVIVCAASPAKLISPLQLSQAMGAPNKWVD